jgi:hypothetical protein
MAENQAFVIISDIITKFYVPDGCYDFCFRFENARYHDDDAKYEVEQKNSSDSNSLHGK